eukprot:scaffold2695_cov452-Prasinococcus_capsulatus_cf.AAC.4
MLQRGVLAAWGQRHGKTARSQESWDLSDFTNHTRWAEHRMIPAEHYWPELAKYRFLVRVVCEEQRLATPAQWRRVTWSTCMDGPVHLHKPVPGFGCA